MTLKRNEFWAVFDDKGNVYFDPVPKTSWMSKNKQNLPTFYDIRKVRITEVKGVKRG